MQHMDPYAMEIGKKIRALRRSQDLTQEELAARTSPPIARVALSFYKRGERKPSVEQLSIIAKALGVLPSELIPQEADKNCSSSDLSPPPEALIPVEAPSEMRDIPMLGVVVAGKPLLSMTLGETMKIPGDLCKGECYGLRVVGESMIGDLIGDGDRIVVRSQDWAENGALAICEINGESCLKRFFLKQDRVELRSKNPEFPTMIFPAGDVAVKGVVVGLIRAYKNGFE